MTRADVITTITEVHYYKMSEKLRKKKEDFLWKREKKTVSRICTRFDVIAARSNECFYVSLKGLARAHLLIKRLQ